MPETVYIYVRVATSRLTLNSLPPSWPLRLRKSLLLFLFFNLELILYHLPGDLIRVRRLQPLCHLQPTLILRQTNNIAPTGRIQHPLLDLRPTRARRNKHNAPLRIAMPIKRKPRLLLINRRRNAIRRRRSRGNKLQRLSRGIHPQLHKIIPPALTQLPQSPGNRVIRTNRYPTPLRQTLPLCPPALQRLRLLDILQTLFLSRKRISAFRMLDVLLPPLGRQLVSLRAEYAFGEVLAAELTDERESRGGEEHFLADGRGIGDVGYGDEGLVAGGEDVVSAEEDVQCFVGLDEIPQVGKVFEEGFVGGWDGGGGDDGFLRYGGEETALCSGC